MIRVIMGPNGVSINDNLFIFDETLQAQIRLITRTNAKFIFGVGRDEMMWFLERKFLAGFLEECQL